MLGQNSVGSATLEPTYLAALGRTVVPAQAGTQGRMY